jgi:hypothetical protein
MGKIEKRRKKEKEKVKEKKGKESSLHQQAQYRVHEQHLEFLLDHLAEEVWEQEDSSP